MADIAIIGTGYVGLTTGACFAHLGHTVVCADVVPEKVERLSRGEIPILEAGLEELVREGLNSGRLRFVVGAAEAAATTSEFAYLCVPTPQGADGSADLSYIEAAAHEIAPVLAARVDRRQQVDGAGRVDPPGRAGARSQRRLRGLEPRVPPRGLGGQRLPASRPRRDRQRRPGRRHPRGLALRRGPGAAHGHRPRLGRDHQVRQQRLPGHQALVRQRGRRALRGRRRRRQRRRARHGLRQAHRPRVPAARAGLGRQLLPEGRAGAPLHRPTRRATTSTCSAGVVAVNDAAVRPHRRRRSSAMAGGSIEGRTIGVWGLTFKANTDDLRQSPALHIVERLLAAGARVRGYDPSVKGPLAELPEPRGGHRSVRAPARAPTCWPCSPSGTSSSGSTSTRSPGVMAAPRIVDARNLLDRRRRQPPRVRVPGDRSALMARVVVTGGAGFLGSHLCDAFLERGDEVVALDNLSTGSVIEHRAPLRSAGLHLRRAGRQPVRLGARAGRRRAALRQPGLAGRLPRASRSRR